MTTLVALCWAQLHASEALGSDAPRGARVPYPPTGRTALPLLSYWLLLLLLLLLLSCQRVVLVEHLRRRA